MVFLYKFILFQFWVKFIPHNFCFLKQSLVMNQKKYVTLCKLHDEQIGWPTIQFTL